LGWYRLGSDRLVAVTGYSGCDRGRKGLKGRSCEVSETLVFEGVHRMTEEEVTYIHVLQYRQVTYIHMLQYR
jgi:hypothetical protein